MDLLRHWLVVNQRGDLVSWVQSESQAKAIRDAYPDAKLRIEGPFVPAEQLRGAVEERDEALRLLANATDPENRGDWDEAREVGWAFARKFNHMWGQYEAE